MRKREEQMVEEALIALSKNRVNEAMSKLADLLDPQLKRRAILRMLEERGREVVLPKVRIMKKKKEEKAPEVEEPPEEKKEAVGGGA